MNTYAITLWKFGTLHNRHTCQVAGPFTALLRFPSFRASLDRGPGPGPVRQHESEGVGVYLLPDRNSELVTITEGDGAEYIRAHLSRANELPGAYRAGLRAACLAFVLDRFPDSGPDRYLMTLGGYYLGRFEVVDQFGNIHFPGPSSLCPGERVVSLD